VLGILAGLPETLDATYERILQEIPKPNRVHAHRLLQCLTAAVRPLAVEELAEVLAIDFDVAGGIPKLNKDFRWADQEEAVLSACSSLIAIVKHVASGSASSESSSLYISAIDEDSRRVQFSHFSVKEFLSSDRLANSEMAALRFHHIHLESAHAIMAQACLGVLLHLDDSMDKKTIEGYPLAKYAGRFFANHAKVGDVLSQNNDGVDHLLDPDRPHFNPWLWLQLGDTDEKDLDFNIDSSSKSDESNSDESSSDESSSEHAFPTYPPRISSLYYTSLFGHQYLTRHLILKRPHELGASDVYGRTPLHWAVFTLDFEATRMLLDRTVDINAWDNMGWTPLHYLMLENGKVENDQKLQDDQFRCVRLLLERGADAEAQGSRGTTPLHVAASNVRRKIVQILIQNVTNIHMRNDRGQTALHRASRRGDADIIGIILNHGADVDAQDNGGSTPLHHLISNLHPWDAEQDAEQAVGVLLEHGADINLRNHEGQTALHKVTRRDRIGIMHLILKHGPDVNALDNNGSNALHLAKSERAVGLLLEHNANINLRNGQGQTALHKTSLHGYPNIIPLILNHGADVDAQDNDGSTPLHLVISNVLPWDAEHDAKQAVGVLLEHGADINLRNHEGQTALHKASRRDDIDVVHLILKHGPDVNALDNNGSTPLDLAISVRAVGLLLEHGANINLRNGQGQTALHKASLLANPYVIHTILKHGADVDAQDNDGSTPLHLIISKVPMDSEASRDSEASEDSKAFVDSEPLLEVIKLLLEHGASGHRENNRGETPFQVAAARGLQEITGLLSMHIQSERTS
jgi:ankyrin repeat protein